MIVKIMNALKEIFLISNGSYWWFSRKHAIQYCNGWKQRAIWLLVSNTSTNVQFWMFASDYSYIDDDQMIYPHLIHTWIANRASSFTQVFSNSDTLLIIRMQIWRLFLALDAFSTSSGCNQTPKFRAAPKCLVIWPFPDVKYPVGGRKKDNRSVFAFMVNFSLSWSRAWSIRKLQVSHFSCTRP